uniref:Uncharacterized protein n=1 Tax=Acrobeloides nanus TaxID=290746 RepID=A0A914D858_9BILA
MSQGSGTIMEILLSGNGTYATDYVIDKILATLETSSSLNALPVSSETQEKSAVVTGEGQTSALYSHDKKEPTTAQRTVEMMEEPRNESKKELGDNSSKHV